MNKIVIRIFFLPRSLQTHEHVKNPGLILLTKAV